MKNKTIKDAVEYYKGVWPKCSVCIVMYQSGKIIDVKEGETFSGVGEVAYIFKQQFEQYVRENKMEKQYKYLNAGIKTVGELVDGLDNEKDYFLNGYQLHILTSNCAILQGRI